MTKRNKNKGFIPYETEARCVPSRFRTGFSIIEMVVVIALVSVAFAAILQLAFLERRVQNLAKDDSQAYILARETIEATRAVRDDNWNSIAGLNFANNYHPNLTGGQWQLDSGASAVIFGRYSRHLEFEEVCRDATDNIAPCPSSYTDTDTVFVRAIVSWTAPGGAARSVQLEQYITNWQEQL